MNGLALGDWIAARLTAQITARTVYVNGVPDGTLPARYLVVWASEGGEESTRSTGTPTVQDPVVWVTSVSRNHDGAISAREAAWGAKEARRVLRGVRPDDRHLLRPGTSSPARRDESIPETTYYAVEMFRLRSSI